MAQLSAIRLTLHRRTLLAAPLAAALQGCAAPFAPLPGDATEADARALLAESAAAHGAAALFSMGDISVSYAGQWRGLVGALQPDLVDAGFRGRSQERWLLRERVVGQAHAGPDGGKQVVRRMGQGGEGDVRVWFNGIPSQDADKRAAAALVVDGYGLFLLGPMLLAGQWMEDRSLVMALAGRERLGLDGHDEECDVLRVRLTPGLGLSAQDDLALYVSRADRLMRRVRFSLNGLDSTRGAVAEVDTLEPTSLRGVRWPTRFHERLLRPVPLPVHDWRLTGLDVDRGLAAADISGPDFTDRAAAPAGALPVPGAG